MQHPHSDQAARLAHGELTQAGTMQEAISCVTGLQAPHGRISMLKVGAIQDAAIQTGCNQPATAMPYTVSHVIAGHGKLAICFRLVQPWKASLSYSLSASYWPSNAVRLMLLMFCICRPSLLPMERPWRR